MAAKIEKLSRVNAHTIYKTRDGQRVPGVTTILGVLNKPALVPWANRLGLQGIDTRNYVDKLAGIGTLAHYMVECHIKKIKPDLKAFSPEEINLAENAFLSYLEWEKNQDIQYLESEIQLVSEEHLFGGTIDCYCLLNGKHALLDFKTSSGIFEEMKYQLAAYRCLLIENKYPVEACYILRIGRSEDEGFEVQKVDAKKLVTCWQIFFHARQIYELKKKRS